MTALSKARTDRSERLKAAKAERKEAYRARTEADRAWAKADRARAEAYRAYAEANYRIRAIEAEP